ncbi:hypothetical protein VDG65_12145 [Xanthomonas campestris pv. raphani]|uniref:Cap15 family cyclic dinucleotide receptor domain-containing protein n=1 Tax=Xanthomonas campestris TaxID=339 RepID=UPI002B226544|nr:hypothetical protein [Xanthomonas campestris]MEA9949520.1 hypothetical protein [Xanthomonas campestris pv. raphani]
MEHEYSVLGGFNRAQIGRYLTLASLGIAAAVASGAGLVVQALPKVGINAPAVLMWPLTAGFFYIALYWLFEVRLWKLPRFSRLLKVPDLSGIWVCEGQQINIDATPGYVWIAELTIVQSWDKLRVMLRTSQSSSNSISAAMVYDKAGGYRLLYSYKNEPRIGEPELAAHRGSAEITFSKDLNSAEGEYFNGYGRYTFGRMTLTRKIAHE